MEDLTDDQVIALGSFCRSTRLHSQFNVLLKQFEVQIVQHMMSTDAHETKKREGIYATMVGVRDFLAHMDAVALEAEKLTTPQKQEPSEYDALPMDEED